MQPITTHTLLLCLGLALTSTVRADHEAHRHGPEAAAKLDDLAAAAEPVCCPTEGKPTRAEAARPSADTSCPQPDAGPAALSAAGGKPCACPRAAQECRQGHQDGPCRMHGTDRDRGQGGGCRPMAGRHAGGHCDEGTRDEAGLMARMHQLERRLDMMQSVLEALLERPGSGRPMGGQRGPQ